MQMPTRCQRPPAYFQRGIVFSATQAQLSPAFNELEDRVFSH
jgi:hypothetical protein